MRASEATRPRPPSALLPLAALLLLGPSAHAEEARVVAVPETRPVQLDGRTPHGEWQDAAALAGEAGQGTIHVQRYRGTLMLALRDGPAWPLRGKLLVYLAPAGGVGREGAVSIDYEPREHDRPHVIASRVGVGGMQEQVGDRVVARSEVGARGSSIEIALPLDLLGLDAEAPETRYLAVFLGGTGGGARGAWPAGLSLRGPRGAPPPDLRDTRGWYALEGLAGAGGPGAFSPTRWEALRAQDAELARLGRTAHARAHLLREEKAKIAKQDGLVEEELFRNLEEIARRERLTGIDLLARAQGLHSLNRYEEALGILAGLETHPDPGVWTQAAYRRALVLRDAGRFGEEAEAWRQMARRPDLAAQRQRYERMAEIAHERQEAWEAERAAREADERNPGLPRVRLSTERGEVELVIYAEDVPEAAARFLELVESGAYDGTRFHRVVGAGLAQGGDPASRAACPFPAPETPEALRRFGPNERHEFFRGTLAFATDVSGLASRQFFLLTSEKRHLREQGFSALGHVVLGMAAVDRLERCDALIRARRIALPRPDAADPGGAEGESAGGGEDER